MICVKKSIFFSNVYNCDDVKGNLDKMFSLMKRCKTDGLQMAYEDLISLNEEIFTRKLQENGVKIVCTHVKPRVACEDDKVFEKAINYCKDALKTLSRFDCEFLMITAFHVSDIKGMDDKQRARERLAEAFSVIVEEAKKYNIKVIVENISQLILPFSTVEDIEYLLSRVPGLHYCFETGNFVCTGTDNIFAFDKFCDRISMVHVKDFDIGEKGDYPCDSGIYVKHTDFGTGKAKLSQVMPKLIGKHPEIPYIIEIHDIHHPTQHIIQACDFVDLF